MKSKIFILIMAIAMCAGCSQSEKSGKNGQMPNGNERAARNQQAVFVSDEVKAKATKTVTGTVSNIVGNEVTLIVTNSSSSDEESKDESRFVDRENRPRKAESAPDNEQNDEVLVKQSDNSPAQGDTVKQKGERPERGTGERRRKQQSDSSTENALPLENKSENTQVYLLPVGMKMGTKDYTSITAGNTIKIYFGTHPDDGSEIIVGVETTGGRR